MKCAIVSGTQTAWIQYALEAGFCRCKSFGSLSVGGRKTMGRRTLAATKAVDSRHRL